MSDEVSRIAGVSLGDGRHLQPAVEQYKQHFPDADHAAIEAGMTITRAQVAQASALSRFLAAEGFSVTIPRHAVLRILHFAGDERKTLNDVRNELGVTSGTVTALVDGLEQDGLVVRVPHPSDRRATILELTADGRRVAESLVASIPRFFETLFRDFTADEKKLLIELLDRFSRGASSAAVE
jgi:DNA-binding MarR family transcriptional regulator